MHFGQIGRWSVLRIAADVQLEILLKTCFYMSSFRYTDWSINWPHDQPAAWHCKWTNIDFLTEPDQHYYIRSHRMVESLSSKVATVWWTSRNLKSNFTDKLVTMHLSVVLSTAVILFVMFFGNSVTFVRLFSIAVLIFVAFFPKRTFVVFVTNRCSGFLLISNIQF